MRSTLLPFVLGSWLLAYAAGHPGGLDANGGHVDRATGIYHYHRTTQPAPEPEPPPATQPSTQPATQPADAGGGLAALPAEALMLRTLPTFDQCRSGPAVFASAWCRIIYDFNGDGDVDQDDFGRLQAGWRPALSWVGRWLDWGRARGAEIRETNESVAMLRAQVTDLRTRLDAMEQAFLSQSVVIHRLDRKMSAIGVQLAWIWNEPDPATQPASGPGE